MGIDFQFDRVEDGRTLKVCPIVDEHTRESLSSLAGTSNTGERVIALIDHTSIVRAYPPRPSAAHPARSSKPRTSERDAISARRLGGIQV